MSERRACPVCNAWLAPDAPAGMCPACLLQQGLGEFPGHRSSVPPTRVPGGRFIPPTEQELAARFPDLEILNLLGQGGMGAVYRARQRSLDRLVALKILPREVAQDPAFAERFGREARTLARLTHPNIVTIFEFGERDELFFLLMEYVDGVNLREAIRRRTLAPAEALQVVPQICDALQYAHEEGVVHRDIKPENVLVDRRGRVKIADFGLAKILGRSPLDITLTASHQVMGTLHYMAPEQLERPLEVDHRADIYSLGVVFYELLTGELPLGRFALPSERVPVSPQLDQVVLKTLERRPEQRYQCASDVKSDLQSASNVRAASNVPAASSFPAAPALPAALDDATDGLRAFHPGRVGMAAVMLTLGLFLLLVSMTRINPSGAFLWVGLGIALGGGGVLASAFSEESRQAAKRRGESPELASLMMAATMGLVGSLLLLFGVAYRRTELAWVGLGLTMGAGGCLQGAWSRQDQAAGKSAPPPFPSPPPYPSADTWGRVRRRTVGPAVGLLLAGMLNLLPLPALIAWTTAGEPLHRLVRPSPLGAVIEGPVLFAQMGSPDIAMADSPSLVVGMLVAAVHLPFAILLLLAGFKLYQVELFGLALAGSVVAMVPCHVGALVGLPAGLWALIVLSDPEVRRAFRRDTGLLPAPLAAPAFPPPKPGLEPGDPTSLPQRRRLPGIGLIVCGLLDTALLIVILLGIVMAARGRYPFALGVFEMLILGAAALRGVFLILGGVSLVRDDSPGRALLGSILALLPCTPSALLSIPCGVWSLVLLHREERRVI